MASEQQQQQQQSLPPNDQASASQVSMDISCHEDFESSDLAIKQLCANYDSKQRELICVLIGIAKHSIGHSLDDPTISKKVYDAFATKMTENLGKFGINRIPSEKSCRILWRQFCNPSASINCKTKKTGWRKLGEDPLEKMITENPGTSARKMAGNLNVSHSTVSRRIKLREGFHLYFYRHSLTQRLHETDVQRRLDFADTMALNMSRGEFTLKNIIFSGEAIIRMARTPQRPNDGRRCRKAQGDPTAQMIDKRVSSESLRIFVALNPQIGVIGPWFIDEIDDANEATMNEKTKNTLSATKYMSLIRDHVIPFLVEKLGRRKLQELWWQQDELPGHIETKSIPLLSQYFGHRILSNGATNKWPAHSPELNPLDYWFWSALRKATTSGEVYNDEETLKDSIRQLCRKVKPSVVAKVIGDFPVRLHALAYYQGKHFEHLLGEYKSKKGLLVACKRCGEKHDCNCETCDRRCASYAAFRMARQRQDEDQEQSMDADGPSNLDDYLETEDGDGHPLLWEIIPESQCFGEFE